MFPERLIQIRKINEALACKGKRMWGPVLSPFGEPEDVASDAINDLLAEVDRLNGKVSDLEDEVSELEKEIESIENSAWERSERIGSD